MIKKAIFTGVLLLAGAVAMAQDGIDANLCDKNATDGAKTLYNWMRTEVWGKKTISGAHALWDYNNTESERIADISGKTPKINIYDFQHQGESWCDYSSDLAKKWQDGGGIVGFNVPGSNNASTYMSPTYMATEGTIENRVMMQDLKQIRDLLLQYQQQGITVVWRPFHEAAGNAGNLDKGAWFWWGADGPIAFRRHWNYVQDYLWDQGVHNLIYVWTSQLNDTRWYPGDDRVDIVARDNYDKDNHASKKSDFEKLRQFWPNKMTALAECGYMPDSDNMKSDNCHWLYVAPWCGDDYLPGMNDATFLTKFMNHADVITK